MKLIIQKTTQTHIDRKSRANALLKMALFPNKNCTSRDIISLRKNILRISQKNMAGVLVKNTSPELGAKNGLNIILSVADSGVIKRITLKSVII